MPEKGMRSRSALIAAVLVTVLVGTFAGFALFALPFAMIAALLLCGRFVGEERILAFHAARAVPRVRRRTVHRRPPARAARAVSLYARAPRSFRGPPAFAATV